MKHRHPKLTQTELREIILECRRAVNSGLLDTAILSPVVEKMEDVYLEEFGEALTTTDECKSYFAERIAASLKTTSHDKFQCAERGRANNG